MSVPIRSAAVGTLHDVGERERAAALVLGEVDDPFVTLSHADQQWVGLHRVLEQAALGRNNVEGRPITQRELVDACIRAIQQAKTILSPRHSEEWLRHPIHQEGIAD